MARPGYLWGLHNQLQQLLPDSRSVLQLGECVEAILDSEAVQSALEPGVNAQEWVAGYLEEALASQRQ
jgi:hypothetical protein